MPVRRPLAATVQLSLAGASLVFVDGRCHKAGGSVTAQLAGVLESPLPLEGTVSCAGARGRLALQAAEPANLPVPADLVLHAQGPPELAPQGTPPPPASSPP